MHFATYTADTEQLRQAVTLAESLRTFGGRFSQEPVWVFMLRGLADASATILDDLHRQGAESKIISILPDLRGYPFGGKVSAAERAGDLLPDGEAVLVFMDSDTIILKEPAELALPENIRFGYRPVMHRNIGLLWEEPLNPFWQRVYDLLRIPESALFPMTTAAAGETVRPYFNAGLLAVRPDYGILLWWARCFMMLVNDPEIQRMCREDAPTNTFLHQAALVAPPLLRLNREEMQELPSSYNYPLFFDRHWAATRSFDSLEGVVTLRYGHAFEGGVPADWGKQLKGDPEMVKWLTAHIAP